MQAVLEIPYTEMESIAVPETRVETCLAVPETRIIPVTEPETAETEEENTEERRRQSYERKCISEEGKAAVKTLIADYLSSEVPVEDNPVIWNDFDRLYELTDEAAANVWVDIVTEWDNAIKGEFAIGDWIELKPCIVVLGYRLNPDGSMDDELVARLDKAIEVAGSRDGYILCSGGNTTNTRAEADAMKEYLTGKGIDGSRILTEDRSRTTIENVICSRKILEEYGIKDIVIVTSSYHLTGATELFQECFLLSGSRINVIGAIGSHSSKQRSDSDCSFTEEKHNFSPATLASWMYDLFLRVNREEK